MTRGEGDVSRPTPSGATSGASGGVCGEPARQSQVNVVVNRQGHHIAQTPCVLIIQKLHSSPYWRGRWVGSQLTTASLPSVGLAQPDSGGAWLQAVVMDHWPSLVTVYMLQTIYSLRKPFNHSEWSSPGRCSFLDFPRGTAGLWSHTRSPELNGCPCILAS